MFWFNRKVDAHPAHSDEWNDGYAKGYNEAWSGSFDGMKATMEFHNAYVQMLERELKYLRQELKKYRQDGADDGRDCGNDSCQR